MFDGCAWLVPFQQPSPERRQVRCGCTWNCQSPPTGGCSRLHRGGWCDSTSRNKAEVACRHSRSATHVWQSRIRRSQGMQLPRSSDQACSTSSARVSSSDVIRAVWSTVCNSLLYGAPASTINKLQRTQNNAPHVVLAAKRHSDAKPLLRRLHWLPVRQRIQYNVAVLTRKVHMTGAPSYLSQHLIQHDPRRFHYWLFLEQTSRICKTFIFILCAPFIWNSLPGDVSNCNSEHTFKKHLKTFFNSCFYAAWLTPPLAPL